MNRPVEETFSDYVEMNSVPFENGIMFQHHRPKFQKAPYHFHPSIEINYLDDCRMRYSFSGRDAQLVPNCLTIFWAAHPHRVVDVQGDGTITNAYVTLSEFLSWQLPPDFMTRLIRGAVIAAATPSAADQEMVKRWSKEVRQTGLPWPRIHAAEIKARLMRFVVEESREVLAPVSSDAKDGFGGASVFQFERMLRFIANHFSEPITVEDVAAQGNLSANYAIAFFNRLLGKSIKRHVTDMRLYHAKMMLTQTDEKISVIAMDSGFGSQSTFYAAFTSQMGCSPGQFRRQKFSSG